MALLALLGISLFAFASFVVGWRLLWLAHRTGLVPEKLIGGSLFLAGGVGTALLILSGFAGPARGVFSTAAMLAIDCGITVLGVFTWRVFRPGLVGATVVATCTALLFLSFASDWVSGHYLGVRRSGLLDDGRLHRSLRDVRLGELRNAAPVRAGAPARADRSHSSRSSRIASCSGASRRSRRPGIWLYSLWSELVQSSDTTEFYLVATVLGGTCALAIWLAFFPPRLYRRWFATSAAPALSLSVP